MVRAGGSGVVWRVFVDDLLDLGGGQHLALQQGLGDGVDILPQDVALSESLDGAAAADRCVFPGVLNDLAGGPRVCSFDSWLMVSPAPEFVAEEGNRELLRIPALQGDVATRGLPAVTGLVVAWSNVHVAARRTVAPSPTLGDDVTARAFFAGPG